MGAKIISQYCILGEYDFINILEAPSNEVVARVASQLGSRGSLLPTTMAAIRVDDLVKEINMANALNE